MVICVAEFCEASYTSPVPDAPVTVYVDSEAELEMEPLVMAQIPVPDVTQLDAPPGAKEPSTLALGTAAPEAMSRNETVTVACQFLPDFLLLPDKLLMATV